MLFNPSHPIRAVVVGEDARVRRALAGLLVADGRVEVVEEVDGRELEGTIGRCCPDAILIDLDRDAASWLSEIASARALCAATVVVAVGSAGEMAAKALSVGADAFVAKGDSAQIVCDAVRAAIEAHAFPR
jgi:DNA-binding NarL/FixJ family response regulator